MKVELEYGMKVANDTYQLSKFGDVELPTVRWAARSEDGDNKSNECGVIVDFTGPGGYDERNRSDECTGFVNGLPRAKTAGDFLITVTLTPPGGGKPIVTKRPIKVIPYGS
ncbi:hypothetical protein nbrc107696_03280 [Gordonia spumicola]|uniref:Uncharacterized protein n=1 Tax=Gordonia spumicola TaxID=589161 RepID=A0A7I9V3X9_9ACTN|nr:hypothetical protein nbrc107696_03280 [Gordonia spumicola]